MRKKIFSIIGCMLSLGSYAQQPLALQSAIDLALKNNLGISLLQNDVKVASILNSRGVAGGLPVVTSTITDNEQLTSVNQKLNTGTVIQRNNAAANNLNANINASILLYNGNRVLATKKRLEQLEAQGKHRLQSQIQNIIADVSIAYYDVVRQQHYIKTIDKSIDASNQQLTIVKARQTVGLANNADLFQAQIDLNALTQSKETQLLIVQNAKTALLQLLTAKPDSAILIEDSIVVDKSISLAAIQQTVSKNPDVVSTDDQIKINELIVKETAALRYPSVRAVTGYNFNRNQAAAGQLLLNQNYGPSIGVAVAIPIYNGNIFKKQMQVANIAVKNAGIQKQILLQDYQARIVNLYQSYVSNIKQYETEQENYNLSGQLLNLVLQRFQLKQATIVEVKNAQQSFEQSGFRLVNLNYAAKVSEISLKRLGG